MPSFEPLNLCYYVSSSDSELKYSPHNTHRKYLSAIELSILLGSLLWSQKNGIRTKL